MGFLDEIGSLKRISIFFAILIIGHYGYVNLFPRETDQNPLWTALGFTIFLWQCVVWASCLSYYYLDQNPSVASAKLGGKKLTAVTTAHSEPPWSVQVPVAARNMVFAVVGISFVAHALNQIPEIPLNSLISQYAGSNYSNPQFNGINLFGKFQRSENETLLRSFLWFFVYIFIADIMFYTGHVVMHKIKICWNFHALHHSSHGLCAISGYYMSIVDFILEHMPVFVAFFLFRECGPAWVTTISIGAFNLLTTHSGWDLPFCPDPVPHFLHHSKHHFNFGIVLDHVFRTAATRTEMDVTREKKD